MNKKGFTIVEMLVIVAIISILVLLASSYISDYLKKAETTHVINDIKVVEQMSDIFYNDNNEYKTEGSLLPEELEEKAKAGLVYDKKGVINNIKGEHKLLSSSFKKGVKSSLPGDFIINKSGEVFYMGKGGLLLEKPLDDKEITDIIENNWVPIATADELQHIAYNDDQPRTFGKGTEWEGQYIGKLDSNFIQVKDIDLSSIVSFKPIGDNSTGLSDSIFTGKFNGGKFKIFNLTIDEPNSDYIGLFGYTSRMDIENVRLMDVEIRGNNFVGGLVGANSQNSSNINNTYVLGNIEGNGEYIGGLIGYNYMSPINASHSYAKIKGNKYVGGLVGASSQQESIIDNSYSTGDVIGKSFVGGLIGYNYEGSTINNSYSLGNVEGIDRIGGLVGANSQVPSVIKSSYSKGNVKGDNIIGGFAGYNFGGAEILNSYSYGDVFGNKNIGGFVGSNSQSQSKVINSYSIGFVKGTEYYIGGFVGNNYESEIIDSFYNITISNIPTQGGLGLQEEEMKNLIEHDNYKNWSKKYWVIEEGLYPMLKNNNK